MVFLIFQNGYIFIFIFQAVAVFLVAVASARASGIGLGLPLVASRGAVEGALGGQWIPDVPVAAAPLVAGPLVGGPVLAAPGLGLGLGWGGVVSARGALEGALGGQWIPDVLPGH